MSIAVLWSNSFFSLTMGSMFLTTYYYALEVVGRIKP